MPSQKPDELVVEEAELNVELATAHAETAAEFKARAERELAEATKDDDQAKLCPNCNGEMVKHGPANPYKAGSWHCNQCGACWAPGLKHMRDNHPQPASISEGKADPRK
jgi:ribosomal protein L37AE/L43A